MWYISLMSNYLERTDSFMASLRLARFGGEVYRVGGSVRDEILRRKVKDADYMVRGIGLSDLGDYLTGTALGRGKTAISKLSLRDGRQAGWRVTSPGLGMIEIVLPRTEVPRDPKLGENIHRAFDIVVNPLLTLDEDAKRRDFTFNALYKRIDPDYPGTLVLESRGFEARDVVDPTGRGIYDLTHKLINVTHADSFRDDPLRTLRALRFISTLDYELGAETYALMALHADAVTGLSAKGYASGTLLDELSKLLMGQCPAKALRIARDTGVLAVAFPELAPMLGFDQGSRYHDMTTDEHTFVALETAAHVDAPLRVRMALLFHDAGKPETAWLGNDHRKHYYTPSDDVWLDKIDGMMADETEIEGKPWKEWACANKPQDHEIVGARLWDEAAARLNAPKKLRDDVRTLILNHMVPCQKTNPVKVRRARVRLGDEMLHDLYLMRMCDLSGKGNKNAKFLLNVAEMESARAQAEAHGVAVSPKDLRINGHDLIELGVDGRDIGRALKAVLDEVVCQPDETRNDREWQLYRAGRIAGVK